MTFSVIPRISSPRLNLKPDNIQKVLDFFFETIGEGAPTVTEVTPPSLIARVALGYKAHINGIYAEVTAAEDRTMTVSQTNWLYLQLTRDVNSEVTGAQLTHLTGAVEPTAPADSVLLAKITTDAVEITAIDTTVAWLNTNKSAIILHEFQHKRGNADEIRLDELAFPTTSLDINQQQMLKMRLENLSADPAAGNIGRMIYRTDLVPKEARIDDGAAFVTIGGGITKRDAMIYSI